MHHIAHFARGGPTDSTNCVLLCTFHHRFVHEGGWRIRGDANGALLFVNRRGREIPELAGPATATLPITHLERIDSNTIATAPGERLDRVLAVHVFHQIMRRRRS